MLLSGTDEVVTESAAKSFKNKVVEFEENLAQDMGIPPWGLVAILIGKEAHAPWHTHTHTHS